MRIPLPSVVPNVGPGGPIVGTLNALAGLQQQQALAQYAPQMQQARVSSLYMSPIAQVLGNPLATRMMTRAQIQNLSNALLANMGATGASAMGGMGANPNAVPPISGGQAAVDSSGQSTYGTPSSTSVTGDSTGQGSNQQLTSNALLSQHPLASAAGVSSSGAKESAAQQAAQLNTLYGVLQTALPQIRGVGTLGNIASHFDVTTPAYAQYLRAMQSLAPYQSLGFGQGLSTFQSGNDLANALQQRYNSLVQNLPQQYRQNILNAASGSVATPPQIANGNSAQQQAANQEATPQLNADEANNFWTQLSIYAHKNGIYNLYQSKTDGKWHGTQNGKSVTINF